MGFFGNLFGESGQAKQKRESATRAAEIAKREKTQAEAEARLAGREANYGQLGGESNKAAIRERVAKAGLDQAEAQQQEIASARADEIKKQANQEAA